MLPCAFFLIEFFIDKIYFDKSTWYLCFGPPLIAFMNVQMSFMKYSKQPRIAYDDQIARIYDWSNPQLAGFPWMNAWFFIAMNFIMYFVMLAASNAAKTT